MSRRARVLLAVGAVGVVVAGAAILASHTQSTVARCGAGLVELGARCCGSGQRLEGSACVGEPTDCGPTLSLSHDGCVAPPRVVFFAAGELDLAPLDWEAAGLVTPRHVHVDAFRLDAFEVTRERWEGCVLARQCLAIDPSTPREPGLPVVNVSADAAALFCAYAGGKLPSSDQLLFAAAGPTAHRYPWGETGAVCRRAAFGMVTGPCATGAVGPDLAGSRPDGASPEGVFDLAGNAAEWALGPSGVPEARGGSFSDSAAASLRAWDRRALPDGAAARDIGLRCAYE